MSAEPNEQLEPFGASALPVEPAAPPRAHRGPQTVINPEGRPAPVGLAGASSAQEAATPGKSSVARLLFPAESSDAELTGVDAINGISLGHYSILERIRGGGMGAVFRALDTRLGRVVALKVLPPGWSRDPVIVQRFHNEAQAAARLDHENIARVYYIGEEDGLHFIAFEYIVGTNVRDLIAQAGRLDVADATNYALQIAAALVHTSAQGVIHRDIKPSNIVITPAGRAKLVDLGLARKEDKEHPGVELTVAGTTLGTFDYISPEQARDPRTADVRSDIYSLGCTLYHMLTGDPPYPEGTVLQKLLQHQADTAPNPAAKNRRVPQNLSAVVQKMMAKDPRRRYQAAEHLVRDLLLVAGSMGLRSVGPEGLVWLASQPRESFWERHLAWMATACVLLIVVGFMEFGGLGRHTSSQKPAEHQASNRPSLPQNPLAATESQAATNPFGAPDQSAARPGGLRRGALSTGRFAAELTPAEATTAQQESAAAPFQPFHLAERAAERFFPGAAVGPALEGGALARGAAAQRAEPPLPGGTQGEDSESIAAPGGEPGEEVRPHKGAVQTGARGSDPENATSRPAATADEEGIFLLGREGAAERRFPTLEAACSAVRNDGAVIELRYNGSRLESALKIARRVTIRADKRFQPVVEFRTSAALADNDQCRAILVSSGSLDLIGVELSLIVDDFTSAAQSSLFSLERPDALRLQRSVVSIVNPRLRPVAVVELRAGPASMMPDMPVAGSSPKPTLEVDFTHCLVRGDADLFLVRQAEPGRLNVRQCVVALRGTLLDGRGASESAAEAARLELKLEHVTAVLAGGLVRLDVPSALKRPLPVQVTSANCIFTNMAEAALVAVGGPLPPQDLRGQFFWSGQNNFYDRFGVFWALTSMEGTGRLDQWDFADWRKHWNDALESNPRLDAVAWVKRRWNSASLSDLYPEDFALDRQATANAALQGASDSTDAGADLTLLPRPAPHDAPAARERPN
jgi:serine/threonine-protein kinase